MSYHTWSVDGFGVFLDSLKPDKESILAFAALTPGSKENMEMWLKDADIEDDSDFVEAVWNDYETGTGNGGIGALVEDVFHERYGYSFCVCDDFDGQYYLLYLPSYPWQANSAEANWTKDTISDIIRENLQVLDPIFDEYAEYMSVENGG